MSTRNTDSSPAVHSSSRRRHYDMGSSMFGRRFGSPKLHPFKETMHQHPCDLSALDLISLCFEVLPLHVQDPDLLVPAQKAARQFLDSAVGTDGNYTASSSARQTKHHHHQSHSHEKSKCSCQEPYLHDLELAFMTILHDVTTMPSLVVASLYTFRGLLFLKLQHPHRAYECFLQCLWVQASVYSKGGHRLYHRQHPNPDDDPKDIRNLPIQQRRQVSDQHHHLELARTAHRLGVALGRAGNYLQAMDQLEYALELNETAHVKNGRHVLEDLGQFQQDYQLQLLRLQSSPPHHGHQHPPHYNLCYHPAGPGRVMRPSCKMSTSSSPTSSSSLLSNNG